MHRLVAIILCLFASIGIATAGGSPVATQEVRPTGFIVNNGQWPSDVIAAVRTPTFDAYITSSGVTYDRVVEGSTQMREAVRTTWTDTKGARNAQFAPSDRTVSFFKGNHAVVARISDRVVLTDVYDGVDVIYTLDRGRLRFDLNVAPQVNITKIGLKSEGVAHTQLLDREAILGSTLRMTNLTVMQDGVNVPASFTSVLASTGQPAIGFRVPYYDRAKPLVIDPIVYGTYVGGREGDRISSVRLQPNGNVVVTGTTTGMQFPDTAGRYRATIVGAADAFVAVMDKALSRVIAYSYIGGTDEESGRASYVDADGNVYLVGATKSADFPTSVGAAGQVFKAQYDAYVVKLNPTLTGLLVASFIGGNKDDWANAVAVDVNSNIVVVGGTTSNANFPTSNGYQKTSGGLTDAFITRLSSNGGAYQFSSFFGKSGIETFTSVAIDPTGSPYVTGSTTSSNFETAPTPGRFSSNRVPYDRSYNGGNTDAFVIKFYSDGSLSSRDDGTYSTFFGGNNDEEGRSVFVDALGRAYVVGVTTSTNLEALGTLNTTNNGGKDIFMAVFAADGRDLQGNTYFGKTGTDEPLVAVPLSGSSAVIGGFTTSNEFPVNGTGTSSERKGPTDGFLTFLNTSTNIFTDLIGGSDSDTIVGVAVDVDQDIYVAMNTASTDMSVFDASYDGTAGEAINCYIAKYAFGLLDISVPRGGESFCLGQNVTLSWSALDMEPTEKFILDISTDNGDTWTELARNIVSRNYTWKPAGLPVASTYRIRVRSERGHSSACATSFSIAAPPSITRQPDAVSTCLGQPASVSIQAQGAGLRYQWRRNGTNIAGATMPAYEIGAIAPGTVGKYDCVITGSCAPAVTSAAADVRQAPQTSITSQPVSTTVDKGAVLSLAVVAAGEGLTYQWMKYDAPIDGATSPTYTVASASESDAGEYWCSITGACGSATSDVAVVVINVINSVDEDPVAFDVRVVGSQPASESIRLVMPFSATDAVVRVIDIHGRQVMQLRDLNASTIDLPVRTLVSGVYVVEITSRTMVGRATISVAR